MTQFAPIERSALADLMLAVGPQAPTLCAGWTTRDLAAHLVVRLTRVDAAAGIMVPALEAHLRRVQDEVAAQEWDTLVAKVRRRPSWLVVGMIGLAPYRSARWDREFDATKADAILARPGAKG